jgi:glycosyltransferase involved in cell wall biosynthesis
MKICWFGIYDPRYARNSILMSGLRANGAEVVECQEDWKDPKRNQKLLRRLKHLAPSCDIIYAAYPAPVPAILAKIFSRKPVVMDAMYSMYDAVVNDRKETFAFHPRALRLLAFDWFACLLADRIIVDTEEHKKYWSGWLFVDPRKIEVVYIGADPKNFTRSLGAEKAHDRFIVHSSGKYIPLQGTEKVVEAARILKDDASILFRLLGWKKGVYKADELIQSYGLKNVERIERVPLDEYNRYMSEADVVLGIFGDTAKAKRAIPNKVFEGMAAGKAVITMDTPAVREIFTEDDICLVKNDPESIAAAVKRLQNDPALRARLAKNGYAKIVSKHSPAPLGKRLLEICGALV